MIRAVLALAVFLAACGGTGVNGSSDEPGEVTESSFDSGEEVGLIGAAVDESHWLMDRPGDDDPEGLRQLDATEAGLVAVGSARVLDDVVWEQVRLDRDVGWLPREKLAVLGTTEDVTALYETVRSNSVAALGAEIASEIEASRLVLVGEPGEMEVIYDVLGLGDRSVAGYRIEVVATEGDDGFAPRLVRRTQLCSNSISD